MVQRQGCSFSKVCEFLLHLLYTSGSYLHTVSEPYGQNHLFCLQITILVQLYRLYYIYLFSFDKQETTADISNFPCNFLFSSFLKKNAIFPCMFHFFGNTTSLLREASVSQPLRTAPQPRETVCQSANCRQGKKQSVRIQEPGSTSHYCGNPQYSSSNFRKIIIKKPRTKILSSSSEPFKLQQYNIKKKILGINNKKFCLLPAKGAAHYTISHPGP